MTSRKTIWYIFGNNQDIIVLLSDVEYPYLIPFL